MDLRSGERALYEGRPSWRALMSFYVGGIVLAAAVVVVLGILADNMGTAIAIAVVIVALTLLIGFLRRVGTKYLLTTQRLRISRGMDAAGQAQFGLGRRALRRVRAISVRP